MLNVVTWLILYFILYSLFFVEDHLKPLQGRIAVEAVLALGAQWKCFRAYWGWDRVEGAILLSSSAGLFHFDLLLC